MSGRRIKALLMRSAQIQKLIDREQSAPAPDQIRLLRLKRLKLFIKDGIGRTARLVAKPATATATATAS